MSNLSFDENKRRQNVQLMESNTLLRMSSCWPCCDPDTSFMTQGFRVKLDTVSKRAESELKQDETTSSCNLIQAPGKSHVNHTSFGCQKHFSLTLSFLKELFSSPLPLPITWWNLLQRRRKTKRTTKQFFVEKITLPGNSAISNEWAAKLSNPSTDTGKKCFLPVFSLLF